MVRPSALAVFRLMTSSNLVALRVLSCSKLCYVGGFPPPTPLPLHFLRVRLIQRGRWLQWEIKRALFVLRICKPAGWVGLSF
jgi:hypothetical protein